MTPITPPIRLFTTQADAAIQVNSLILDYNGNCYNLPGSTGDTIHVFTESICLYVLTINATNSSIGLNAFMVPHPDPLNCIYMHTEHQITSALGSRWKQLSFSGIARKLIDYLL